VDRGLLHSGRFTHIARQSAPREGCARKVLDGCPSLLEAQVTMFAYVTITKRDSL